MILILLLPMEPNRGLHSCKELVGFSSLGMTELRQEGDEAESVAIELDT